MSMPSPVLTAKVRPTLCGCVACGHPERRPFLKRERIVLGECTACGLVYADPQHRKAVDERYEHEYDLDAHFTAYEQRKAVLYRRRLDWLPRPSAGRHLLCDVGCGNGQFLALAAERGWTGLGMELNPPAAARVRARGLPVVEGRAEDTELRPDPSTS